MEFRFIYVNIFCWTKYDKFRFERNVNTQGSKSTADRTEGTIRFEKNANAKVLNQQSFTRLCH